MKLHISILLLLSLFILQGSTLRRYTNENSLIHYKINLKGITSGSEKTIIAGPNDLLSVWKNMDDSLKEFTPEEKIAIEMSFFGTDALLKDTLPLSKIKKFPKTHLELLSNCEIFNYDFPEWTSPFYNQTVVSAEINTKNNAPQGKGCLKMEGTDDNNDGYICALTRHFRHPYSDNSSVITSRSSSAENTWIFFYVYGEGQKDDIVSVLVNEEGLLSNNMKTQDFYVYNIPLNFYGWKQFAIRYADLKPIVPGYVNDSREKFGQQGDRLQDPKKLAGIQFTLRTKAKGSKARCYLDNLMIIYN